MRALVTAARSNNLKPLTHTTNKHLIPLANKPMIFHVLEHIASAGIKDIGVVINENDIEITSALSDGSRFGVNITYIKQWGGTLGLGHVVKVARNFLGDEKFVLYLGDNLVIGNLSSLVERFEKGNANCLLVLAKVPNPQRFGVPEFNGKKIIKVEERPLNPKSEYAVTGLYFYDSAAHIAAEHLNTSSRGDYEISDIHTWLAQNNYNVDWVEVAGWWKDRANPKDLLEGNKLILQICEAKTKKLSSLLPRNKGVFIEPSVRLEGLVEIGEGTKIGGKTLIRGPVSIGEYCLIKDSYVGPYTSIGNKTEIHGGDVEHSLIFDDVSITTGTKIADSVIGSHTTISSKNFEMPQGSKIIVGENSNLAI